MPYAPTDPIQALPTPAPASIPAATPLTASLITPIAFTLAVSFHAVALLALGHLPKTADLTPPFQPLYAQGQSPLDVTLCFISAEELVASDSPPPQPPNDLVLDREYPVAPPISPDHTQLARLTPPPNPPQPIHPQPRADHLPNHLLASADSTAAVWAQSLAQVDFPPPPRASSRTAPRQTAPLTPTRPQPANTSTRSQPCSSHTADSSSPPPTTTTSPPAPAGIETGVQGLDLPKPEYPLLSRRFGEQGLVLLEVEVLPTGQPGQVRVIQDPGHPRLVQAALAAAHHARFTPATRQGHPVPTRIHIPFEFKLK